MKAKESVLEVKEVGVPAEFSARTNKLPFGSVAVC
jgi:hypothetical protein